MSRKSLNKKEQLSWYFCEICNIYIMPKDRQQHNEQHNENDYRKNTFHCFIYQNTFSANEIKIKPAIDELDDLPIKQLNNFIFLSESIMNQCGMILNSFVTIIKYSDHIDDSNLLPIIRCVWPLPDKYGTSVYTTEDELINTWSNTKKIEIQKLSYDPIPTDVIVLQSFDTSMDDQLWNDLKMIILKQMKQMVYCCGNIIRIDFFNKIFKFQIKELIDKKLSDVIDNLIVELNELKIEQKFYIITKETKFQLYNNTTVNSGDDDEDVDDIIIKDPMNLIGGLNSIIKNINDVMDIALGYTKSINNFQIYRSILLYGLPGCGKSLLCDAIISQYRNNTMIIKFNGSDIFSKYFGETEAKLLQYFDKAFNNYPKSTIIVIEEISNICGRESKEESSKRICSAFLNILDKLHMKKCGSRIVLLTTTSNIDILNLAVRRYGRLDMEIEIPVPDPIGRDEIFQKHLNYINIKHNITNDNLKFIANNSHGFVGADLVNLLTKAIMNSINRNKTNVINTIELPPPPILNMIDINYAFTQTNPSAMKEVQLECPNVKWTDIGGQHDLKLQLKQAIEWPLLYPEKFLHFGINPPRGVLMFGPPGCSKTMIAKALATESKLNFLSIKGPELFSMWVGESERAVRELFRKARQVAPAIIFFDEIDAIGSERTIGNSGSGGSSVKERVLAQILTEIDGVHTLNGVTIVAATNRPDLIDKALMRPGRIDRIVYVRLPDAKTRKEIFQIKFKRIPINYNDVIIDELVQCTDGYSGAELQAICQEAALIALQESFDAKQVNWSHFQRALQIVQPRTNTELLQIYEEYLKKC